MVPNRLSYVPSKRLLPLQSPEQIHRCSQESSRLSPNSTLRDKLGPLHQPKETIRPQPSGPSILKPSFPPQFMKDLNNHSVPSHTRSNQVTESKVVLSSLGGENITAQRQESNKVLSLYVTHWNLDLLQCSVYDLSCSLAVPSMLNNSWSWSFFAFWFSIKTICFWNPLQAESYNRLGPEEWYTFITILNMISTHYYCCCCFCCLKFLKVIVLLL